MEEKLILMAQSYQQELAGEQARRIQAEAELTLANRKVEELQRQVDSASEDA